MLGRAIAIAATVHEHQKDKGGNAYILHPMRIMMRLRTNDEDLMCMAILHDVVEDSDWTIEKLNAEGFSDRVLAGLSLLTHNSEDDYETYIQKISTNKDAILVKLQDLKDNSDITRLKGLSPKDVDRMVKYQRAFKYLEGVLKAKETVGYL